jgi:hypothetical protein
MRESDLPSPDIGGKGFHLRRITAQAISQLQVGNYGNGRHPAAVALSAFFAAAKAAADALLPAAPTTSFTPTAKTYTIAGGAAQAGPTLAKGGSDGAVTYTSATPSVATVNSATGAINPISAGTSVITAAIAASGGYLAATRTYTATVTA